MADSQSITREGFDQKMDELNDFISDMSAKLNEAYARDVASGKLDPPPVVDPDVKARSDDRNQMVRLSLETNLRATLIHDLDRRDRLAECDRDELVAEADFIEAGKREADERWEQQMIEQRLRAIERGEDPDDINPYLEDEDADDDDR